MMQDIQHSYNRRAILSALVYDSDYRLSLDMLDLILEAAGLTVAALTDRGLEIARGKARAHGIRDLRPSEISEMAAR